MNLAKPHAEKDNRIVAIVLVKGVPFYGYHVGYQSFLKIYIANPTEKQKIMDLLQSEAIMETCFQPFEAHISFELQFLMDHNLYGMDWLHIDEQQPVSPPQFRQPLLHDPKSSFIASQSSSSDDLEPYPIYTALTVPENQKSINIPRESYCELELDITGMSILNRLDLIERDIHTSLELETSIQQEALANPEEESKKKLVKSLESIWKDEDSRRKARGITDPIPPVTQTDERDPHIPWNAENTLRKLMDKMMNGHTFNPHSSSQEKDSKLMIDIMTVFQAVEALYPEEYHLWKEQRQRNELIASQYSEHEVKSSSQVSSSTSEIRLPSTSENTFHGNVTPRCVTPPLSSQPKSSQFNVSATPTRYNTWDLPSKLDKSILNSLIRDPSFLDDEQEIQEDPIESLLEDDDDDDYFSQSNLMNNDEIAKWMETHEKYPTTTIEYETSYQPRKLDFLQESERIDSILHQQPSVVSKKDIFNDLNDEEKEEEEEKEVTSGDQDIEDMPFEISSVPPNPV